MHGEDARFEIVRVISDFRLLDADQCEWAYWRRDGRGLSTGWYVVSWPAGRGVKRFNEDAEFHGPFRIRDDAEFALQRLASRALARSALAARKPEPADGWPESAGVSGRKQQPADA